MYTADFKTIFIFIAIAIAIAVITFIVISVLVCFVLFLPRQKIHEFR